jgi:hypothetical protein
MSAPMAVTMRLSISRQARDRYSLDMFRFSNDKNDRKCNG